MPRKRAAKKTPPALKRKASTRTRALDQLIRPTRAEIDLEALAHNFGEARRLASPAEVLAVVKANAYGHGSTLVAKALERAGCRHFAVALVEEGIELRNAGIRAPTLVLGGAYDGGYDRLVEHNLTPTVFRTEHLSRLQGAAEQAAKRVAIHLKVDTGMGRIGVLPSELEAFLARLKRCGRLKLEGLLSHFANADLASAQMTADQIARFKQALATVRAAGFDPRWRHLSNSAGVLDLPEVRDGLELNLVRPGLMLYGIAPAEWLETRATLRPVLSWKTAVTHVKRVPEGTPISYGSIWVAPRPSVIATLPIGYADGYSRSLSNKAPVLIRGRRAGIVGRVCMDMCMIDVTDVPGVQVGDEVVLIGEQKDGRISATELAQLSETISYEVLCAVSARVPRIAVDS